MLNLSIIILNYNTKDLTLRCLESIFNHYLRKIEGGQIEVILVDNASSDGSVEKIKNSKFAKKINLIESRENLGFAKGNNLGAQHAKGEYLLFLNSDTEVKDIGFERMTLFLKENPNVGILGGKLYFPDGKIQPSVGKFYNLINLFLMLFGAERLGALRESPNKITKVDWVSGACVMIRKNIFRKIGGFDKKIFMYMEDVELCYSAKKIGFDTYFYPNLSLLHKERGSSNKTFAIVNIYKGVIYFYKKHKPGWQYKTAKLFLLVKALISIAIGTLTFNKNLVKTYKSAIATSL